MLSGYVIGVSTKKPLTWATSGTYVKKRLVRLYPIFLLMMLLTVIVSVQHFGLKTLLGNALFLQGIKVDEILLPAWSLNYEMVYYAFFIVVSIFRLNPFVIATVALPVGLVNWVLYPTLHVAILSSYSFGLIYWILGLGISRQLAAAPEDKASYQVLLGALFYLLCIDQFNPVKMVMERVGAAAGLGDFAFPGATAVMTSISFYDLSYLLFALVLILTFVGKRFPYRLPALQGLVGLSAVTVFARLLLHAQSGGFTAFDQKFHVMPAAFLLAALVCLFWRSTWLERAGEHVMRAGKWLGELSYGVYLAHFPLMLLFGRVHLFAGTPMASAVRWVLFLALSIGLGYLLEKVMQPRIKAFFFKESSSLAIVAP